MVHDIAHPPPATAPAAPSVWDRAHWQITLGLLLVISGAAFEALAVATTLPATVRDLGGLNLYGWAFSAFMLANLVGITIAGAEADRQGPARPLLLGAGVFVVGLLIVGFAPSMLVVIAGRAVQGFGSGVISSVAYVSIGRGYPESLKPRMLAMSASAWVIPGLIGPALAGFIADMLGWRWVFLIFGIPGIVWAIAWYRWFRDEPTEHPAVSEAETQYILNGRVVSETEHLNWSVWKRVLSNRTLIFLCIQYFTQSYGFYFFITWLPQYLREVRGFDQMLLGLFAGMPMVLSTFADLVGGVTTDWAARRFGLRIGRCAVGGLSLLFAGSFLIFGAWTSNPYFAVALLSFALASANFLLGAAWGTCGDIAGSHAGAISGCMNTAGQVGGFLCPIIVAHIVQNYGSWNLALYLTGAIYLTGAFAWLFIEPRKPIL